MITVNSVGTELHHDHRFVVLQMPRPCLFDDAIRDHFCLTSIRVPTVVPVETYYIHVHSLQWIRTSVKL